MVGKVGPKLVSRTHVPGLVGFVGESKTPPLGKCFDNYCGEVVGDNQFV